MVPAVKAKKHVDVARLAADLAGAKVELLSAQCATDRIRLQFSPQEVAAFGDRHTLQQAIASVEAVYNFFSQIGAQIRRAEEPVNGKK
jgi:hypothetical protein